MVQLVILLQLEVFDNDDMVVDILNDDDEEDDDGMVDDELVMNDDEDDEVDMFIHLLLAQVLLVDIVIVLPIS